MAVQCLLAEDNQRLIADGMSADEACPAAVDAAGQGFDLLNAGLGRALSSG